MSLIVETGSGLSNSESYLSVADADAHHTKFGNTTWTGTEAVKEVALRKATRYLDLKYISSLKGDIANWDQALQWPRTGVILRNFLQPADEIPQLIKDACAEAALIFLSEEMMVDSDEGFLSSQSVSIGPISESKTFIGGKEPDKSYPKIEAMMINFISTGGRLIRG